MPGHPPGWHPLRPDVARRFVNDTPVEPGDLVLDFGAGTGALTLPLAHAGCRVVAVELSERRARQLAVRVADQPLVRVVVGDMLLVPLPRRPFAVVANPPFAGSWALLRRLLGDPRVPLRWARIVLDERLVRCIASDAGSHRNEVGRWRQRYRLEAGQRLPPHAFRPAPSVGARVLVVEGTGTLGGAWASTRPARTGAVRRTTSSSRRRS